MSKGQSPQLQIEYCSPHELRPCPYNATFHSKQQIQKIVKSLRRFGCVNPVLVSDTKEIIAGHARVKAATYLDLKLIPIIRLSNLTPAERLAYIRRITGWPGLPDMIATYCLSSSRSSRTSNLTRSR